MAATVATATRTKAIRFMIPPSKLLATTLRPTLTRSKRSASAESEMKGPRRLLMWSPWQWRSLRYLRRERPASLHPSNPWCVLYHGDLVAQLGGKANRCLHARVCYEPDDDELVDAMLFELQI